MLWCPMHSWSFEPCLHYHFVATLHRPRTNGPALCLILRILHTRFAFLQIGQLFADLLYQRVSVSQLSQFFQHSHRTIMFEVVELRLQPTVFQEASCSLAQFPKSIDVFTSVRKV